MFCTKCGKENEDGAKFCNGCGATFESPVTPVAPVTPVVAPAPASTEATAPAPQQPKKKTGLIIGIVVAVVAVIIAVVLAIVLLGGKDNNKKDDKDDDKTTKVEETVDNKDKETAETTTEAVVNDPLVGKWQHVATEELAGYDSIITQTQEITMEFKNGKWICTEKVYLDMTKEEFIELGRTYYESNYTAEEIDEAMSDYGYDSLDEYIEDEYDSLVWDDETEFNYSYDEKEERLYLWEDGGSKNEDVYYPISVQESGNELSIWFDMSETTFTRVS